MLKIEVKLPELPGAREMERLEEAAEQEEALQEQMKLEAMTLKQLQAEMLRLGKARKEAAATGDTQAYRQLTAQYNSCKAAAGQMAQQSNLSKAAMMGQASAGMQFAGQLQSLGQQVASGSTDIAGMATQVMALGAALRAGLGPVGLIMGAIQALQTVIQNWSVSTEKVTAANIHHSMKKHPYLTDDDIMLLSDITSNCDEIRHEKKKEGDRLVYTKTYGDTTYEVAERIGRSNVRTSPKQLFFATEYITKHPADNRD